MFVPQELKHLIGKVSEQELEYYIQRYEAIQDYILKHGKPTSMAGKLVPKDWGKPDRYGECYFYNEGYILGSCEYTRADCKVKGCAVDCGIIQKILEKDSEQ